MSDDIPIIGIEDIERYGSMSMYDISDELRIIRIGSQNTVCAILDESVYSDVNIDKNFLEVNDTLQITNLPNIKDSVLMEIMKEQPDIFIYDWSKRKISETSNEASLKYIDILRRSSFLENLNDIKAGLYNVSGLIRQVHTFPIDYQQKLLKGVIQLIELYDRYIRSLALTGSVGERLQREFNALFESQFLDYQLWHKTLPRDQKQKLQGFTYLFKICCEKPKIKVQKI